MFNSSNIVPNTEPENVSIMQAIKKILNIYCWGLPSWIRLERSLVCNVLPKGLILLPQEIKNLKLRLRKKIQSIIWYEVYLINIAVLGPENNGHHWIRIWFFFFCLNRKLTWFPSLNRNYLWKTNTWKSKDYKKYCSGMIKK